MTVTVNQQRAFVIVAPDGEARANQVRALAIVRDVGENTIFQTRALAVCRIYPKTREIECPPSTLIYVTNPW